MIQISSDQTSEVGYSNEFQRKTGHMTLQVKHNSFSKLIWLDQSASEQMTLH